MTDSTPGWQPDPTGRHDHRYWDGSRWTDDVADAGVAATDPYDGPVGPGAQGAPEASPAEAGTGGEAAPPPADTTTPDAPAPGTEATVVGPTPAGDPTATWPAAGTSPPPPSYTAPPPPTMPVAPAAAAAASSGSKKGLLIGTGVLALVALVVGAFLLLGDDDGDQDELRAEIISVLNEDGELTDAQAECLAEHMIDELGEDRLEGVDFSADEPPAELEDDFTAAAFSGLEGCEIDMSELAGGDDEATDGTTDDTATDDGATDTTDGDVGTDGLPSGDFGPEFEEMLADIYADSFGISQEKAECLAGKIADAMESGELSEEEMMNDIFGYFSDCDISMSEISGN